MATNSVVSFHLLSFAESFITPEKSRRYADFAKSEKGIKKWINDLDHFQNYLNKSRATPIFEKQASSITLHADKDCEVLVFSTLRGLAGVTIPLSVAVEKTYKMGNGSIVSIVPGKLALYFGEEAGENYILER